MSVDAIARCWLLFGMTEESAAIDGVSDLAARVYRASFRDTVYSVVPFREPRVTSRHFRRKERHSDDEGTPLEPLRSLHPRTALFVNPTEFASTWSGDLESFNEVMLVGVNTDNRLLGSALTLFDEGVPVIISSSFCLSSDGTALSTTALQAVAQSLGNWRVRD